MGIFVITRSIDDGKTVLDYLSQHCDYTWVESGAIAKWFQTEEEAQIFLDTSPHHLKTNQNLFIKPYDPVTTLVKPTETDRNALTQDALLGVLAGGTKEG